MDNRHFHVITGASGGGKSTLVDALRARGYSVVPEMALAILQEQVECDGPLRPETDPRGFMEAVFARSVEAYDAALSLPPPVFFDRAIPECLGHMRLLGLEIGPAHEAALAQRRYAGTVLVAPPWPEIYVRDRWRQAEFARASRSFEPTVAAYTDQGYAARIIPQVSVEERVAFVLRHVGAG